MYTVFHFWESRLDILFLIPLCFLTSVLAIFFWICLLSQGKWKQNKQMELHQTKKLLHSEGNDQQNEKAAYWMGEDICKIYI